MTRVRFVKKFVLFTKETSLGEDGKLHTQEGQYHIKFGKIYDIDYIEERGQVADIKFSLDSPMKGGFAYGVSRENFEILRPTVGTKNPPSGCGGCG